MCKTVRFEAAAFFQAPRSRNIHPVQIAPGVEYVEIITGGRVWFECEGVDRVFGRGAIFWHQEGEYTVYRNDPEDPYRCLVLRFVGGNARERLPRISCWRDLGALDAFCREMLHCAHDDRIDREVLGPMMYYRLIWEGTQGIRQNADTELPAALRRAASLLEREYGAAWSVAELARRCGVSPSYLHALFERHWGVSPHQYLLRRRLHHARMELASGRTEIKEIARRCGFENLESFYRAFRKHCDQTPAGYRRMHGLPEMPEAKS